jgi:hypothetical protein
MVMESKRGETRRSTADDAPPARAKPEPKAVEVEAKLTRVLVSLSALQPFFP